VGILRAVQQLRRLLTGVTEAEERLTAASQREQARADAFRIRKEVLKAAYTTARAEYLIEEAAGQHAGDEGTGPAELSALTAGRPAGSGTSPPRSSGNWATRPRPGTCWTCARARPATAASASCSPSSRPAPRC